MSLGFVEDRAYHRAREFLIRNEPEQRLDTRLSKNCFRALEDMVHKLYGEEAGYPRVEYSPRDSTVTIITAQSGLHAMAAVGLQRSIEDGLRTEVTNYGRGNLFSRFIPIQDMLLNERDDQSNLAVKKPDGGLLYEKDGVQTIVAVIEIGVSESFARLKTDLRRWMDEFHCHTGIQGKAKVPVSRYSANDAVPFNDAVTEARLHQPFGPYHYNGHDWFGTLDTAFIEIYRRGQTGPPQKTKVIENGQMLLQGHSSNVGLTVADLFPHDEEDIQGIEKLLIRFDAARVQNLLASGACRTAVTRFNNATTT
ncbi:hypothetical protein V1525DRAFT_426662 [Lipomyces kononenkoae]|uniref:Uncharacterized protein n=1 Tax=Lipomyces kononenkoae TaxID=34357 RepID=A0ACC3SZR8_LIPKO